MARAGIKSPGCRATRHTSNSRCHRTAFKKWLALTCYAKNKCQKIPEKLERTREAGCGYTKAVCKIMEVKTHTHNKKLYKVRHIRAFLSSKAAFDNILRTETGKASEYWRVPRRLQKAIGKDLTPLVGQIEYPSCPRFLISFPFEIHLQKTLQGHLYLANSKLLPH